MDRGVSDIGVGDASHKCFALQRRLVRTAVNAAATAEAHADQAEGGERERRGLGNVHECGGLVGRQEFQLLLILKLFTGKAKRGARNQSKDQIH